MEKVTTIAVDIAKRILDLYWVEEASGEIRAKTMTRAKFEEFMHLRESCRVVLEAGGSAHYWGRWLERRGHEVRLIAAQHVRPFVRTNKIDRGDARAIWEAVRRPEVKWIAVKSEASQAVLGLHRMREQLKQMRCMQSNQLSALLYEFGVVTRGPITAAQLQACVAAGQVPELIAECLGEQLERITRLKREELDLKRKIERHNETDALALRVLEVPGIGTLTAERALSGARRRSQGLRQRPSVCCLQGDCSAHERQWRQDSAGRHQQARRPVCTHASHSRRAQRDCAPAPHKAPVAVAKPAA